MISLEAKEKLRLKLKELIEKRKQLIPLEQGPYDEVYFKGLEMLDKS